MPPKDKQWFRNYAVFYKAVPARIEAIEELIVALQNEENLSRSDALKAIFDAGVEIKAEDPRYGSVTLVMSVSEARLFHALSLEVERQAERAKAYEVLGPLGILDIAERLKIDPDSTARVLEACKQAIGPRSEVAPSHAYKVWITHHLQDGKPRRHKDIVERAIEEGVLPDPEKGEQEYEKALSLFRHVASGLGVSGGPRGWWKFPKPASREDKGSDDPF